MKDTTLYAPFDGIISIKYVENFEYVKAKQPIALLQNLNEIDVEIYIPEYIVINIQEGEVKDPQVIFQGLTQAYPAKLKEFSTQADQSTLTYRAIFTLKSPGNINILPGMTVQLKLSLPDFKYQSNPYNLLPSSAVFHKNSKSYVFVVDPKTQAVQQQEVTTGDIINHHIKILSGLSEGQVVVTAGAQHLQSGQLVKPIRKP